MEQPAAILVILVAGDDLLQILHGPKAIAVLGESGISAQEVLAADRIAFMPGCPVLLPTSILEIFPVAHLAIVGS